MVILKHTKCEIYNITNTKINVFRKILSYYVKIQRDMSP